MSIAGLCLRANLGGQKTMFRELKEKEIQEFIDCVKDDTTIKEFFRFFDLVHPITKEEIIRQLKRRF